MTRESSGGTATATPPTSTTRGGLSETDFNMLVSRMAGACSRGLPALGVYASIILHFNSGWSVPNICPFTTLGENVVNQSLELWQASGVNNIAAIDALSLRAGTTTG